MINVCVVGYGAIGPVHAEALERINNVKIYGVCDTDKFKADAAAKKHNAKAFYNYDDCIKDKNIDFIHICTPHYLHYEMITKALNAGKRVVVEKPAVMKKCEFDMLIKNYNLSEVYPILQNRTNTCVEKIKEFADSNKFGKIKGVKAIVTWSRDAQYYNSAEWRGKIRYEGGGVLINQSVHALDLMIHIAGSVDTVNAVMQNNSLQGIIEVEDTVSAYLKFKNGASGIFFATNAYTKNSPIQLEVDFENAYVTYNNGKLYINDEFVCSDASEYNGKAYWGNGHTKVIADLYENDSQLCLNDIKDTMYTMFAIYEKAAE